MLFIPYPWPFVRRVPPRGTPRVPAPLPLSPFSPPDRVGIHVPLWMAHKQYLMAVGVSGHQFPPYLFRIVLRHMFYIVSQNFPVGLSFSSLISCLSSSLLYHYFPASAARQRTTLCVFARVCVCVCACTQLLQSCLILCNGLLPARLLYSPWTAAY